MKRRESVHRLRAHARAAIAQKLDRLHAVDVRGEVQRRSSQRVDAIEQRRIVRERNRERSRVVRARGVVRGRRRRPGTFRVASHRASAALDSRRRARGRRVTIRYRILGLATTFAVAT